jgi:hypothetical protein
MATALLRVLYVSSACLQYVAFLSLDGINAGLPRLALLFQLLQHKQHTFIPSTNWCLNRNIASLPLFRPLLITIQTKEVVCSIYSVPLLTPFDIVQTDFD